MNESSDALATIKAQYSEFCREFDQYIMARYRYKRSAVRMGLSNTVGVSRSPVDLYLRYKPRAGWPAETLVIARIGFARTNKGEGTAFLRFLTEVAARNDFQWIGLEQTHDGEDVQGFIKKFGFSAHKDDQNWLVSIQNLSDALR